MGLTYLKGISAKDQMVTVTWTQTRFRLGLCVTLNWKRYQESPLTLPPQELGRCREWRFEVSTDETSATFVASWDLRMVNRDIPLETITERVKHYASEDPDQMRTSPNPEGTLSSFPT